jgi:hypothetical protein
MPGPIRYLSTITIVYEYRGGTCLHIVRVVAGDPLGEYVEVVVVVAGGCEVPHPSVVDFRGAPAVGDGEGAVRGLYAAVFCGESLTQDATTSRNPRPTRRGQPRMVPLRNQRELL